MVDSYNTSCKHSIKNFQVNEYSLCVSCGAIVSENVFSVKPNRYFYPLEFSPSLTLQKMKNEMVTFSPELLEYFSESAYQSKRKTIIRYYKAFISRLKFKEKTYYLALNLLDSLYSLNNEMLAEKKFEWIAIGCLVIAVKYSELDPTIPDLSYFQTVFGENNHFNIEEVKLFEINCLKKLGYKLNFINPYQFLTLFISHGIVFSNEYTSSVDYKNALTVYSTVYELMDYTLHSKYFYNFRSKLSYLLSFTHCLFLYFVS